jgi:hypothetical protein
MYILAWLAMLCGFLGVLCGLGSFGLHPGRGRRIGLVSSASLIVVGLAIIGGLAFARRPVCEALGGGWNGPESSCFNEWGGNGDYSSNGPKA